MDRKRAKLRVARRAPLTPAGRARATPIFVYGTLLAGEAHHALLAPARLLGAATTRAEFDLVDCGEYPAMVRGGRTVVTGELYAVDDATRARLDRLEEHPRLFRREPIVLADGRRAEAYLLPRPRASRFAPIVSGSWSAHRSDLRRTVKKLPLRRR